MEQTEVVERSVRAGGLIASTVGLADGWWLGRGTERTALAAVLGDTDEDLTSTIPRTTTRLAKGARSGRTPLRTAKVQEGLQKTQVIPMQTRRRSLRPGREVETRQGIELATRAVVMNVLDAMVELTTEALDGATRVVRTTIA